MIKLASYNCNSIRNNLEAVKELLNQKDIVFLQELMLNQCDLGILKNLNKNFSCIATVKDNYIDGIMTGRPSKGVAIFFKNYLLPYIMTVEIDERLNGIIIESNIGKILALNVYLPYDNNDSDSLDNYRLNLATISSIIDEYNISNLLLSGDFNADPNKGRFWRELKCLIEKCKLKTDVELNFSNDSVFTYLSPAHSTTSWIDHILMSNNIFKVIRNVFINYDLSLYDHFPLCFSLDLKFNNINDINNNKNKTKYVKWHKMSKSDFVKYNENVKYNLTNLSNSFDINQLHERKDIDFMYDNIINVLLDSSEEFSCDDRFYPKCIPGWNDQLKDLYIDAKIKLKSWKNMGMPIPSSFHEDMKQSRKIFKKALNKCKRNENNIRNEKMVESLHKNDTKLEQLIIN